MVGPALFPCNRPRAQQLTARAQTWSWEVSFSAIRRGDSEGRAVLGALLAKGGW